MTLDVLTRISPSTKVTTGAGVAIDTEHVKTEVPRRKRWNGVIGGIYTQNQTETTTRIPFFGDLPYIGFKNEMPKPTTRPSSRFHHTKNRE